MNEWFSRIANIVGQVAKDVNLPEARGASDGDSWIWTWRNIDEGAGEVAEAQVRVSLDTLGEGMEIEVSAAGWMLYKRQLAAGRPYYVRYIEFKLWPKEESTLKAELMSSLRRAWKEAPSIVKRLPELERERNEAIEALREKKVFDG